MYRFKLFLYVLLTHIVFTYNKMNIKYILQNKIHIW